MASKAYVKALKFQKWLKKHSVPYKWHGATRHPTIYVTVGVPYPSADLGLLWLKFRFSNHPWGVAESQLEYVEPHLSVHPASGYTVGDVREMVRNLYEITVGWPP